MRNEMNEIIWQILQLDDVVLRLDLIRIFKS